MFEFIQNIADRFRSPIFGNFIFSWLVWNWKIPYVTFFVSEDNLNTTNKLDKVISIIEGYGCYKWVYLFFIPFFYTVFMIVVIPIVSNWAEMIRLHFLYKLDQYSERKRLDFQLISKANEKLSIELGLIKENSTNELKVNMFNKKLNLAEIFIGTWMIQVVRNNISLEYKNCVFKTDKFVSPERTVLIFDNFHMSVENNQSPERFSALVNVNVVDNNTKAEYSFGIESRDNIRLHSGNRKELGFIILTRQSVSLF